MIAFKGFNNNLQCTMGKGTYQYEIGKKYKEDKAKCVSSGFHCVEEPIEVLKWYPSGRWCMVEASGDIHEDGDARIACTEMKIIKEMTKQELGMQECVWLHMHPDREYSRLIKRDIGEADKGDIVIVRGKNPKAAGEMDATIFLLKEEKRRRQIEKIGVYKIDGKDYMPNVFYTVTGREVKCRKTN